MLLLFFAGEAMAQSPVGELLLLEGKARIRRAGKQVVMDKPDSRQPVFERDIIITATNSKARLEFDRKRYDGNEVTTELYAKTHFVVTTASAPNSSFMMGLGKALFSVGTKLRGKRFNVNTPTATIGVKGTKFLLGSEVDKTFVVTLEGVVSVISHAFRQLEVLAEINQATMIAANLAPTPPIEVPADLRDGLVASKGLGEFQAMKFPAPPAGAGEGGGGEDDEGGDDEGGDDEGGGGDVGSALSTLSSVADAVGDATSELTGQTPTKGVEIGFDR